VFEDDIKGELIWMMTNIRKSRRGANGREAGFDMLQFGSLSVLMAKVVK
jgi:hypothetical protein